MARQVNWSQAFAEVLILVVGVGLAVFADSWNDRRLERIEEVAYLDALRSDFDQTRSNLQSAVDLNTRVRDNNIAFLQALSSPRATVPAETLRDYSKDAFSVHFFQPVLGTYYDMVNSGKLELLQNDSLRLELARFEVLYEGLESVVEEGFQ